MVYQSKSKFILITKETGTVGTVKKSRKNMLKFAPTQKNMCLLKKSENMLALKWHNKREVHMITTIHKGQMIDSGKVNRETNEPVMKPNCVLDYNKNIRLVDKSDMQISSIE